MTTMTLHKTTSALLLVGLFVLQSTTARTQEQPCLGVREMFSLKSIQMVQGSVCLGLRASCRVCARF